MTKPILIERIDLRGFRGFLKQQSIVVRKSPQNSLAILANNANGKSSLVDALEYYFKEGKATLARLGIKTTDKQAGRKYVNHVAADEDTMMVRIKFWQGDDWFDDSRTGDHMSDTIKQIVPLIKVPFIIRDYELREFVQENQYNKLVEWFNLQPLSAIQENLRALKGKISDLKKNKRGKEVLLDQLKMLTSHEFQTGDELEVLQWLNENMLAKLDNPVEFKKLAKDDPAYQTLAKRIEIERNSTTADRMNDILVAIQDLFMPSYDPQVESTGLIYAFEKAILDFENATASTDDAKCKITDYVFKEIWAKSQELLLAKPDLDKCPVCETPFASSSLRSRDAVLSNLHVNLDRLDEYTKAEENKAATETILNAVAGDLKSKLSELFSQIGSRYQYAALIDYNNALQSWQVGNSTPYSIDAISALTQLHLEVTNDIKTQNKRAYSDALTTIKQLLDITAAWNKLSRIESNLESISKDLDKQSGIINRAIVKHIDGLIDKLESLMQTINQEIQGPDAIIHVPKIKLAKEVKQNQRTARVFTNFMNRGEDVPPDGILSESQNRTLALAIRLAAISMFNTEFKIIVLDDVTMSYDEEKRQHIATLLHERFSEFQIIVTTHDNFFFEELRDRFQNKWRFLEFVQFKDDYGPIIKGKKTLVEIIDEKIANDEPINGHEMRMAYEEWLNHVCSGFATLLPYRPRKRPEPHHLIESLGKFLSDNHLKPPPVSGYTGNYLEVMKRAKFLNITSHYNPHLNITSNELKTVWREFSEFKNRFRCGSCDSECLVKEQGKRPSCAGCGEEFAFVQGTKASL